MDISKLNILVVEDNPVYQYIVERHLKNLKVNSKTVSTGVQAIEALKTKEFDLVLMDINMPEQDGLDAARWIRDIDDDYYKNIPIFALTSFGEEAHTAEILESGMNEHMQKPFDTETFLKYVEKHVKFQ
jgi:CheY-like chemotaxis protein